MLIGSEKIREIVERTDLLQLIGKYVQLRRVGRSWVGLCPFHEERTPSFYVTPARNSYKCFGCQRYGDSIRFVMEYEGKDFPTAARELAAQAGVEIVYDPKEHERIQQRRELLWACEVAARFFERTLWSEAGAGARAYLQKRGIDEELARKAGLGYALPSYEALRDHLIAEKVPVERAVEAGLLGLRDRGRTPEDRAYDVFRARLMVPIRDGEKRVIAFGGRILEGDDPRKYINSRETPLYTKSRVLYGMDVARDAIRSSSEAVLVEGYFDALALWQAGIFNAVALCSTVLTADHVRTLERLGVETVTLVLDGDEAGRDGVMRLAGPLLQAGLGARVVELPDGHDPDTFLDTAGKDGYEKQVERAPPLSRYVVQRAQAKGASTYEEKLRSLAVLRPIVAGLAEGPPRALFLEEVARSYGLPPSAIASWFDGNRPRQPMQKQQREGVAAQRARNSGPPPPRRELELAARLFARPALREAFGAELVAKISHASLREAVASLLVEGQDSEELLEKLDPELGRLLDGRARALARQPGEDWEQEMRDGLLQLDLERLQEERRARIAEREALERDFEAASDEVRKEELRSAMAEIAKQAAMLRGEMERLRNQLRGLS